jgi:maltokinase
MDRTGRRFSIPVVMDGTELRRARPGDGISAALLASAGSNTFRIHRFHPPPNVAETAIDVDQSNESIIVGDAVVVKWQIDLSDVPSPAPSRMRALHEAQLAGRISATIAPDPWAIVEWLPEPTSDPLTIATATAYLPDSADGWEWAVARVRSWAQGQHVDALTPFARLGEMTADMHTAFAAIGRGTADAEMIEAWRTSAQADLDRACELIDGVEGERLRERAPLMAESIHALAAIRSSPVIAIHGDFHIGQILRSGNTLLITDFDGSPVRTPRERLELEPTARDVAGMLASIDHVARVVNYRTPGLDSAPARGWISRAQTVFLDAYRRTLAGHGLTDIFDERLLLPFQVQQEAREFIYAATHLPHWRYVPDAALSDMFPCP